MNDEGLADAAAASPFRLPRLHPGIRFASCSQVVRHWAWESGVAMLEVGNFYDALAPWYHLVYQDWEATIGRQGRALSSLLASEWGSLPHRVLDAAVGIGTQALGPGGAGLPGHGLRHLSRCGPAHPRGGGAPRTSTGLLGRGREGPSRSLGGLRSCACLRQRPPAPAFRE